MTAPKGLTEGKRKSTIGAYRVVLIYFIISVIWIFGSDTLVNMVTSDTDLILELSIIKGAGFVIATSVLLYYLVSRELKEAYELREKDRGIRRRDDILRTLADNFPKGSIMMLDLQGRPLEIGDASTDMAARDLKGRGMTELIANAVAGRPGRIEIDETDGYYLVEAVPVRDDDNSVFSVLVIYDDITEIKRSEEALSKKVRELATLFSISRSLLDSDEIGEMLSNVCRLASDGLNLGGIRIFRFDAEQGVLRETAWSGEVIDEGAGPSVYSKAGGGLEWTAFKKGTPAVWDASERKDPDHRVKGAMSGASLPLLRGGDVIGVLSVYSKENGRFGADEVGSLQALSNIISMGVLKLRYIEEIEDQKRGLEIRVAQRTQDLMEVNEQLDSFAHSISHDLQAPVRGMKGMAEALIEDFSDSIPPRGREYLVKMVDNSEQLEGLIQDTLTYSRIRSMELNTQPIDLRSTLEEALSAVNREVLSTRASVMLDIPNATVAANRTILKQVMMNLMTNAMKFTKKGERPEVKVLARIADGRVRISVIDKGIGIPASEQAHIFRPFVRLHSMEDYPGTGVGLAIVSKGVEKIGGAFGVISEEGKGSEFWVELAEAKTA